MNFLDFPKGGTFKVTTLYFYFQTHVKGSERKLSSHHQLADQSALYAILQCFLFTMFLFKMTI